MLLAAEKEQRDADRLMAAQHAVWTQAAVSRGVGMLLGGKGRGLVIWDLVPDLEPAEIRRKRDEARREANVANWMAAAAFLSMGEEASH